MANVLIGIIGVILFIGLALAAVLFLGPQFQQATNNSKGSAAVQVTAQVAQAANLAYEQTGTQMTAAADVTAQLVTPGYLKVVPTNPVVAANVPQMMTTAGVVATGNANVAVLNIGTNDQICTQVGIQTGQLATSATAPASGTSFPTAPVSGCIKAATGAGAGMTVGNDYVFTNI